MSTQAKVLMFYQKRIAAHGIVVSEYKQASEIYLKIKSRNSLIICKLRLNVGPNGLEPMTSALSRQRSEPTELRSYFLCQRRDNDGLISCIILPLERKDTNFRKYSKGFGKFFVRESDVKSITQSQKSTLKTKGCFAFPILE